MRHYPPICPHVEEVEPRLLPQGGPWHVLGDWLKQLTADARQAKAAGALADPYCQGADPGPCDAASLRDALSNLANVMDAQDVDAFLAAQDAGDRLGQLVDQGAPLSQVLDAQETYQYLTGREVRLHADAGLVRLVTYNDDAHIAAAADRRFGAFRSVLADRRFGLEAVARRSRARALAIRHEPHASLPAAIQAEGVAANYEGQADQAADDLFAYAAACPGS